MSPTAAAAEPEPEEDDDDNDEQWLFETDDDGDDEEMMAAATSRRLEGDRNNDSGNFDNRRRDRKTTNNTHNKNKSSKKRDRRDNDDDDDEHEHDDDDRDGDDGAAPLANLEKKRKKKNRKQDKEDKLSASSSSSSSNKNSGRTSFNNDPPTNDDTVTDSKTSKAKARKKKKKKSTTTKEKKGKRRRRSSNSGSSSSSNDDNNTGDDDDDINGRDMPPRVTPKAIEMLVNSGRGVIISNATANTSSKDDTTSAGKRKNKNTKKTTMDDVDDDEDKNAKLQQQQQQRGQTTNATAPPPPPPSSRRVEPFLPVILSMSVHGRNCRHQHQHVPPGAKPTTLVEEKLRSSTARTTTCGVGDGTTNNNSRSFDSNASNHGPHGQNEGNDDALFVTVEDDKHSLDVVVMNVPPNVFVGCCCTDDEYDYIEYLISVDGYMTTGRGRNGKYNHHLVPFVCLTSFQVLNRKRCHHQQLPPYTPPRNKEERVHCGNVGTFLSRTLAFFTNDELLGSAQLFDNHHHHHHHHISNASKSPSSSSTFDVNEDLDRVKKFMSHHNAMLTLQTSSVSPALAAAPAGDATKGKPPTAVSASLSSLSSTTSSLVDGDDASTTRPPSIPPSSPPIKRPTEQALDLYESALRQFTSSQMARATATLGTNTGKESADRASLVAERHNSTLELAMKETTRPLSVSLLCEWHTELLRGIDSKRAGKIRSKSARCGNTYFASPCSIRTELDQLCAALLSLEKRLDLKHNARHALLYACVAMYGVVDIHPFSDGNGRLSRIVCNWALRQRLPFPINLFATPSQRAEYVFALETTRHRLSLGDCHGHVSQDDVLRGMKTTGIFGALVNLLSNRIAKTTHEWERLWEEKNGLAAETAEAQAARRVRERAARGTCIICLEEKPNIATLCCGKPIHLNCIAEWLSQQTTCPICRTEMPRVVRPESRLRSEQERALESDENRMLESGDEDELSEYGDTSTTVSFSEPSEVSSISDNRDASRRLQFAQLEPAPLERSSELFEQAFLRHAEEIGRQIFQREVGQRREQLERRGEERMDELDEFSTSSMSSDDAEAEDLDEHDAAGERSLNMDRHSDIDESEMFDVETTTTTGDEEGEAPRGENEWAGEDTTTELESDYADNGDNGTTTIDGDDSPTPPDANPHEEGHQQEPVQNRCHSQLCRNRAAIDCINNQCGRCCQLHGHYHCPRHNA